MNRTGAMTFASIPDQETIVLLTADLAATVIVGAVDLYGCAITGEFECVLRLEVSTDGATWVPGGPALTVYNLARDVRLAVWPDQVSDVSHIRVVILNGDVVTGEDLSLSGISILEQAEPDGNVRFWPFSGENSLAYMLAVTARNADIFRDGAYLGAIPLPYSTNQILRVQKSKRLDTLLAYHENVPTHRIFRDGSDTAWISEPQVLEDLPLVQFEGETYTNGKNEIQRINFDGLDTDDTFNILLEGERTSSIAKPASYVGIHTSIKTALEALDNLGAGTIIATMTGSKEVTIEFTGDAGQKDWPEMFVSIVDSNNGVATVSTVREGEAGGEEIISAERGYFRTGLFWSGRTSLIGSKAFPLTAIASQFGDYFNFEQGSGRATDGLEYLIDGADDDGVRAARRARYPLLFTTSSVYFLPVDALDGEKPPGALMASPYGFEETVPPQSLDGAELYIQQGGNVVGELLGMDRDRGFADNDVSIRASHLIKSPIDAASRPAGRGYTTGLYSLVLADGEMATLTSHRAQDVAAWARDATPGGKVLAVGADKLGRRYVAVKRGAGNDVRWSIEGEMPDHYFDASVIQTLADADVITGLDHLEGQSVYAHNSDEWHGPMTVLGGEITLPDKISGEVEIGLFYDASVQVLDVRADVDGRTLANRRKRVKSVEVSLEDSAKARLIHLGESWDLQPSDETLETDLTKGPLVSRTTGWVEVTDLSGDTRDVNFSIHRAEPGPFLIRAIVSEVTVQ